MRYRINVIVVLIFSLLAGYKSIIKESQSYISKKEAIDMALEIASSSRPEISGAQITPHNVIAQQMTFDAVEG